MDFKDVIFKNSTESSRLYVRARRTDVQPGQVLFHDHLNSAVQNVNIRVLGGMYV